MYYLLMTCSSFPASSPSAFMLLKSCIHSYSIWISYDIVLFGFPMVFAFMCHLNITVRLGTPHESVAV